MISQGLDLVFNLVGSNISSFSVPALTKNQRSVKSGCKLIDFINYLLDSMLSALHTLSHLILSTVL